MSTITFFAAIVLFALHSFLIPCLFPCRKSGWTKKAERETQRDTSWKGSAPHSIRLCDLQDTEHNKIEYEICVAKMSVLASMQYYLSIISPAAGVNCKRHDTIFLVVSFFFFFFWFFQAAFFLCALFCSKYILLIQQKRKPETHAYLNHR